MDKKNLLNSIQVKRPNRNMFDLSHDVKLSLNMGWLVPTMCVPCIPGDKFNIGCDSLLRFAPLVSPVMHRMDVTMHYFFVPNRILWDNWENFITNTPVVGSLPAFPFVTLAEDGTNYTKLLDYLGIPSPLNLTATKPADVSALPMAAFQMIYNEYYRDQNLVPEVNYKLIDGDNSANGDLFTNRRRAWEHDYYTSALPFAQKGNAVAIPITPFEDVSVFIDNVGGTTLTATPANVLVAGHPSPDVPDDTLYANTSELNQNPTTINDLRRAFRLQEWLEKSARGGSRYIEAMKTHFNVNSSDKRLSRPEYITGTKSPVIISEVLQTSETGSETPQGNMAGHGVSVTAGKYGSYYCEEHGYIIGIMSVLPKTAYQQGMPKHFMKINDPFEHYWPEFANIGEQAIDNNEIYAFQDTGTFGYTPRYAEYKFENNRVAGDFRDTLDFWHCGRIFAAAPELNQLFIEADPTTRIFAVETGDLLYAHVLHKIRAIRAMPKYGTPMF